MKLSILVPSIRPQNLAKLYNSIKTAFSGEFEMIVASPYDLPEDLRFDNVKLIRTFRAPLAAQQEALCSAEGEYISWAADDGYYLPGSIDRAFELINDHIQDTGPEEFEHKILVMGKYQEGDRVNDHMEKDEYYILNNHHGSQAMFLPEKTWMLNCGIVSRKILLELGGWDSKNFWACPIGYNDLAIRLQKYGCKFIIQQEMMFTCSHMPGETGDHAPLHIIQTRRDEPMYKEIYNHPYFSKRLAIDIDNWKQTPERFENRFGNT